MAGHLAFALTGTAAALAVAAGVASGATLRYEIVRDGVAIGLTANTGEANRVTVSRQDQSLVFADHISVGLRLNPPTTSCRRVSPQELRCAAETGANTITLGLGDGDDVATVTASDSAVIAGGSGDDTLAGGAGGDEVDGGLGNDRLTGGPGPDRLLGGVGNDAIDSRDGVRDTVLCGLGFDRVRADQLDGTLGCESVTRS